MRLDGWFVKHFSVTASYFSFVHAQDVNINFPFHSSLILNQIFPLIFAEKKEEKKHLSQIKLLTLILLFVYIYAFGGKAYLSACQGL